jgi:hypothetical protein
MHLAYGILVPEQVVLTQAANCACQSTVLQHVTVPYLHGVIETHTHEDELMVLFQSSASSSVGEVGTVSMVVDSSEVNAFEVGAKARERRSLSEEKHMPRK